MKFEQHILGPFPASNPEELRVEVERMGKKGFELVGLTSAGGWLYVGVKRPYEEPEQVAPAKNTSPSRKRRVTE